VHLGYDTWIWLSVSNLPLKCAVVSLYSVVKQRLMCNNGKVCNCLIHRINRFRPVQTLVHITSNTFCNCTTTFRTHCTLDNKKVCFFADKVVRYSVLHLQFTAVTVYCSYSILQLQCTAVTAYCSYSILQLQCTAVTACCSYSVLQLQRTAVTAYRSYSVPQLQCSAVTVYRSYSLLQLLCTEVKVYCSYSVPQLQFTAVTVYCSYSVLQLQRTAVTVFATFRSTQNLCYELQ
jgi:hypothetical protein